MDLGLYRVNFIFLKDTRNKHTQQMAERKKNIIIFGLFWFARRFPKTEIVTDSHLLYVTISILCDARLIELKDFKRFLIYTNVVVVDFFFHS